MFYGGGVGGILLDGTLWVALAKPSTERVVLDRAEVLVKNHRPSEVVTPFGAVLVNWQAVGTVQYRLSQPPGSHSVARPPSR